ncbi:MAG: AAA family ATPase, partial [Alphaproteobacteria bacterium]|nr:AAA family ATPase [Alphaproteobacteria bacterium]
TLNQLLVEMDGFETNEGVIMVAATNRPDVLDPALLRPGRFDRQVTVPNPDVIGREMILKVHMGKVPLAPDVDAKVIARGTPGFSGADLANLVNEAALVAARKNRRMVTMAEFEEAKDKVLMGAERRSMVMTEDEKKLTAYHEAGHALVGLHIDGCDPLHKVTIIPRGRALGVTMSLPERDRYTYSIYELKSKLAMMFGGRVAEELIFGKEHVTTGAGNDIKEATNLARRMITEYGFSEKLGPLRYEDNQEEVFLGHSVSQHKNVSDATAKVIDDEIRVLIDNADAEARRILTENIDELHTISNGLLEYETLSGDEVQNLLKGMPIDRSDNDEGGSSDRPRSSVPSSGTANKKDRPSGGMEPEPQPQA